MHSRFWYAAALLVSIASPGQAVAEVRLNPSQASLMVGSLLVVVPFYLSFRGVAASGNAVSATIDASQRWKVGAVHPAGEKTGLELHCDDQVLKLDMAIDTRVAQEHGIQVGDAIDIEAIGKAGYVVRKGAATIALMAEPGSGMAHSRPRS